MDSKTNVFISYSHKDMEIKKRLEKLLTDRGLNVLSDSMNQGGKELHKEIYCLLTQCSLLFFSYPHLFFLLACLPSKFPVKPRTFFSFVGPYQP